MVGDSAVDINTAQGGGRALDPGELRLRPAAARRPPRRRGHRPFRRARRQCHQPSERLDDRAWRSVLIASHDRLSRKPAKPGRSVKAQRAASAFGEGPRAPFLDLPRTQSLNPLLQPHHPGLPGRRCAKGPRDKRAVSSAGRALCSHRRGHWFESSTAHHAFPYRKSLPVVDRSIRPSTSWCALASHNVPPRSATAVMKESRGCLVLMLWTSLPSRS